MIRKRKHMPKGGQECPPHVGPTLLSDHLKSSSLGNSFENLTEINVADMATGGAHGRFNQILRNPLKTQ